MVRLEKPAARHRDAFLRAVRRSRQLHRPWVKPPSDRDAFTAYVRLTRRSSHLGWLVLTREDELAGFIIAVAAVRPDGIHGMKAKSVRKKMKQRAFAAAVNREDIIQGAEDLGVDLNEHIQFVIDAMAGIADDLEMPSGG